MEYRGIEARIRSAVEAGEMSEKEALSQFNLWKLKKDEIKLREELAQEQFGLGTISSQALKEFQLQTIQQENSYQSSLDINIDLSEVTGK